MGEGGLILLEGGQYPIICHGHEKYFNGRLNIQVCVLLQVLTSAAIKMCIAKQVLAILKHK